MVLPGAGPHAVLNGSQLKVRASFNKPLDLAALRLGEREFVMSAVGDPGDAMQYEILLPTDGEGLAGGQYEFVLTDQTGLTATRPTKFTIKTKEDSSPKVRAELLGISGLVVPRARIPVSYSVNDEFGLSDITLDCNWKNSDEDATRNETKTYKKVIRKFEGPREYRAIG